MRCLIRPNGFYEKAKFVKGRRGGCSQLPRTVTCAPLHLLLSALSVGRLLAARCMMRSVRTLQALQSKVRSLLSDQGHLRSRQRPDVSGSHVVSAYWLVNRSLPFVGFQSWRGAPTLPAADPRTVAQKQPPLLLKSPTIERCAKARRPLGLPTDGEAILPAFGLQQPQHVCWRSCHHQRRSLLVAP